MKAAFGILLLGGTLASACSSNDSTPSDQGDSAPGIGGMSGDGNAGASDSDAADRAPVSDAPSAGLIAHPNPIISRTAQVFSSPAGGGAVVDGAYHNGGWTVSPSALTAGPAWVALKLAAGATRVLVSWDDGGTYNYQDLPGATVYGLPASYHIDVSADSTNGADGAWTTAVTVGDTAANVNQVRTRAHALDFSGMSWVKMVITAAAATESANGVQIGEIDVHDISTTATGLVDDTWFFMGDSITAYAFDRGAAHQPSFAKSVNAASAAFFPAMINGGIGGEKASDGLARLAHVLDLNPDYRFIALGYGTNDAGGTPVAAFSATLQSMIDMVKAAGRIPVIPRIPYSGDGGHNAIPTYNTAIDQLVQSNQLVPGPDLYAHFMENTGEFVCPPCSNAGRTMTDNLHPNDVGLVAINTLWATAMRALYP
jgi:lysophospholipase L1-like esterase